MLLGLHEMQQSINKWLRNACGTLEFAIWIYPTKSRWYINVFQIKKSYKYNSLLAIDN